MRECNNSKIHISSNFLLSICLIVMLDTLLLVPTLHWNTSLYFTTLHQTTRSEGKVKGAMEVTGRRGRRQKQLLDDLKERRGYSHLKEEALDRTMWRGGFGRGFGPVVRQNAEWNEWSLVEWEAYRCVSTRR